MCAFTPHAGSVTPENCLAFSSWFQNRKGYASILRERGSVHRQSSPVSGQRPPWWIMLPNSGSGLSQLEHAPIAGRHTNMPLSPFPRSSTRIDIVPWQIQVYSMSLYQQMSALVSGEKQIKKRAITPGHFNRACCGMNGITHGKGQCHCMFVKTTKLRPLRLLASP